MSIWLYVRNRIMEASVIMERMAIMGVPRAIKVCSATMKPKLLLGRSAYSRDRDTNTIADVDSYFTLCLDI